MPPTLETTVFSSRESLRPVVPTEADSAVPILNRAGRDLWQKLIEEKLVEWGTNPDYFADEEFDAPLPEIVSLALRHAQKYRDNDWPPPHRIVPDGDGGIVFEVRNGSLSEKIHLWDDGEVDYICFSGAKLVERRRLPPV
jgi:hypothetical protein